MLTTTQTMKYLAIDYGLKRTGLALSDPTGVFVYPFSTIKMQGKDAFFEELFDISLTERVEAFIVGLPLRLDGSESETTRIVRNFSQRLRRRTSLPIYLMEEALSSYEAESTLRKSGMRGKKLAQVIDQQAAVAILQSFLNLPENRRKQI